MNIKIVYADRIDAWDTRADGSATTSHAVLRVHGQNLELWSKLKFDDEYDERTGQTKKTRTESGTAESILRVAAKKPPQDLAGFLAVVHDECGLLRLDVDGESIYEYEEEDEASEKVDFFVPKTMMPDE